MDRPTLRDWAHRFNAEGAAGLVNRAAPGNPRHLTPEQEAELARVGAGQPPGTPMEVWFQDEMRIGQKTQRTRVWVRRGTRPRQVVDQRTGCAYLFGSICPERQTGAAIVMQRADTQGMQHHLNEISANVSPGAHAVPVLDQAGWHTSGKLKTPDNITLVPLPPRSPELNPAENS